MNWLNRLLFGPPDTCDHCWHEGPRSDCRHTIYNTSIRCCKCGQEVLRA